MSSSTGSTDEDESLWECVFVLDFRILRQWFDSGGPFYSRGA